MLGLVDYLTILLCYHVVQVNKEVLLGILKNKEGDLIIDGCLFLLEWYFDLVLFSISPYHALELRKSKKLV
jgi:hypothetical protein